MSGIACANGTMEKTMEQYQTISMSKNQDEVSPDVYLVDEGFEQKTTIEKKKGGYLVVEWEFFRPKCPEQLNEIYWFDKSSYFIDRYVLRKAFELGLD